VADSPSKSIISHHTTSSLPDLKFWKNDLDLDDIVLHQNHVDEHKTVDVAVSEAPDDKIKVELASPNKLPKNQSNKSNFEPITPTMTTSPETPHAIISSSETEESHSIDNNADKNNESIILMDHSITGDIPSSPILSHFRNPMLELHKLALASKTSPPPERTVNRQSVELRALQSVGDANLIDSSALFTLEDTLDAFDKAVSAEKAESKVTEKIEKQLSPKSIALSKLSPRPEYGQPVVPKLDLKAMSPKSTIATPTATKTPKTDADTTPRTKTPKVLQRSNTLTTMLGEKKVPRKTSRENCAPTNGQTLPEKKRTITPTPTLGVRNRSSSAVRYGTKAHREVIAPPSFTQEDLDAAREEGRQQTLSEWNIVQMDYDQIEKDLKEQKSVNEALRRELVNISRPESTRIKEMEAELKRLRDTESHMTESFTQERNKHSSEVKEMQKLKEKQDDDYQKRLTDARRTLEEHYDTLRKELESKVELANGQVKALATRNAELISDNKKMKALKEAAAKTNSEYKTMCSEHKLLQYERSQLLLEKGQLQLSETNLKKKVHDAEKKLTESQALTKKYKDENVTLRSRIEELEKVKREADQKHDLQTIELSSMTRKWEEAEKHLKERDTEALRMKGQIYDSIVEIENLKKSNNDSEDLRRQIDLRDRALVSLQEEKNRNNKDWEEICNELLRKCEVHGILPKE
jgi:hypothetical protein